MRRVRPAVALLLFVVLSDRCQSADAPAASPAASAAAQRRAGRAALPPLQVPDNLALYTDLEYGRAGERALKLDLVHPKDSIEKPRPVIVFVHGGGWRNGDKSDALRFPLMLIARGGEYVCVSVGYRLTGEATWPSQIYDCKAAIRWLRANAKKYGIKADRIGVWGSSAGGHLVAMLGTSGGVAKLEGDEGNPGESSKVTCVVDFCGPTDFPALENDYPADRLARSAISGLLGGPLTERREMAIEASPITYVSADDPPFLIVHGTEDPVVPIAQAERLDAALKKAGTQVIFVKVVGAGHGFGGAPGVSERVMAFLDKYLRDRDVSVSDDPIQDTRPKQPAQGARPAK